MGPETDPVLQRTTFLARPGVLWHATPCQLNCGCRCHAGIFPTLDLLEKYELEHYHDFSVAIRFALALGLALALALVDRSVVHRGIYVSRNSPKRYWAGYG